MNANHRYGAIAAVDAWKDAGFARPDPADDHVYWEAGAVLGTGVGGLDTVGERLVPMTDAGKVRRLGSTIVEQVMGSGVSARVSGLLALGNQVTSNSSACSTGTRRSSTAPTGSGRASPTACCAAAARATATTPGPGSTRCACSRAATTTSPRGRRAR